MFDLSLSEMLICAIVAVVVIGPKDMPRALMTVGRWVAKARGMTRNLRTGFDAMVREAEMQELEKQWAEHNAKIMREHPQAEDDAPDQASAPAMSAADDAPRMEPLTAPAGNRAAPPSRDVTDPDQPSLPLGTAGGPIEGERG